MSENIAPGGAVPEGVRNNSMQFGDLLLAGVNNLLFRSLLEKSGYAHSSVSTIEELADRNRRCDLVILSENLAERVLNGNRSPELCTRIATTAVLLDEPYAGRSPTLREYLRNGTLSPLYGHEIFSELIVNRIEHLILFGRMTRGKSMGSDNESERIRLEEEIRLRETVLRNEQETNANIFASMSSGLMLIDRDGTILRLNQAARRYLGAGDGAIGSPFRRVLPRGISKRCEKALAALETLEESVEDFASGGFYFRLSVFPIRDYRSILIGILLHLRDITEQENAKAQLYRAERLASMGTMLSGIAHELRNPLSIISAAAQRGRIKRNQTRDWNNRNYESIENQALRCATIVNGLLDFARGETFHPGDHEVKELVREALGYISYQNLFDNIRLEQNISSGCRIHVDRPRFVQALVNLLINAAQAMDGGGVMKISADSEKNGAILLHVQDTGPGIPSDTGDRIFDPFYTTKAPGHGTGLGLAIVHRIVQDSGGTIDYQSKPGDTCFRLRMPSSRGSVGGVMPVRKPPDHRSRSA